MYLIYVCSAWLSANDDPLGYVKKIDQRIEDITNLDMSTAEQLQVISNIHNEFVAAYKLLVLLYCNKYDLHTV